MGSRNTGKVRPLGFEPQTFPDVSIKMVNAFASLGDRGWELFGIYDKSTAWLSGFEVRFALSDENIGLNLITLKS